MPSITNVAFSAATVSVRLVMPPVDASKASCDSPALSVLFKSSSVTVIFKALLSPVSFEAITKRSPLPSFMMLADTPASASLIALRTPVSDA